MLDRYDQDLLLDYLEGELDADQRAQLEATLADDPQLAALLQGMAQDRQTLRDLPREEAPASLTEDVTQTLERRMLLDDDVSAAGPIPISRGRALHTEPTGIRWKRIGGLSGLAAAVAVAAGVVVYTMDTDPLNQTARELAESTTPTQQTPATEGEAWADTRLDEDAPAQILPTPIPRQPTLAQEQIDTLQDRVALAGDLAQEPDISAHRFAHSGPQTEAEQLADRATQRTRDLESALAAGSSRAGISPGTAVALATAQPRQQLVVFTQEPSDSKEVLVAFCVNNGIPIVQNTYAQGNRFDLARVTNDPQEPGEATRENDIATPDIEDGYALLINQTQLNALVTEFNGIASAQTQPHTLETPENTFNKQVAVINELPQGYNEIGRQVDQQANALDPPQDQVDDYDQDFGVSNDASAQDRRSAQNPVELRLPEDLGSPYANTRNRDNIELEQRRNAYRSSPSQTALGVADQTDEVAPALEAIEGLAEQGGSSNQAVAGSTITPATQETPRPQTNAQANDSVAPATPEAPDSTLADADATTPPTRDVRGVGAEQGDTLFAPDVAERSDDSAGYFALRGTTQTLPSRVYWLGAHLPHTNTTPILNWEREVTSDPTQLVPIAIQFAPAEQVQVVLREQQAAEQERAGNGTSLGEETITEAQAQPQAETELLEDAQPQETDTAR